jgi:hypothetical protein
MTEFLQVLMLFIIVLGVTFIITGGVWWVVLWSFNFPIMFAWKQVIGVWLFSLLMNSSSLAKD